MRLLFFFSILFLGLTSYAVTSDSTLVKPMPGTPKGMLLPEIDTTHCIDPNNPNPYHPGENMTGLVFAICGGGKPSCNSNSLDYQSATPDGPQNYTCPDGMVLTSITAKSYVKPEGGTYYFAYLTFNLFAQCCPIIYKWKPMPSPCPVTAKAYCIR